MADQNKYYPPSGAPPNYPMSPPPAQAQYEAGPMMPYDQNRGFQPQGQYGQYYGPPQGYDQYGNPYQNQYGPPQGYYAQPGMQYGQPMPSQGYYVDNRGGPGAGEGCCAALLGALACCCCLELLF